MRLAFYKAAKGTLFSKTIALITGGVYSHVELVFDAWNGRYYSNMDVREHDRGGSLCFSSAGNDGGTRFKILDLNDGKWDTVPVALDYERAFAWCIAHQHREYDWRGLYGFVLPWEKPDPDDLFCSEAAVECFHDQHLFMQLVAGKTSPNALAKALGVPSENVS